MHGAYQYKQPNSVTSIGNRTFLGCMKLSSVIFEGTSGSNFSSDALYGDLREILKKISRSKEPKAGAKNVKESR